MKEFPINIISGEKKILLSAPHAFLHKRPRLSTAWKVPEPYTDDLVISVTRDIDAMGIVLRDDVDFDPNYHTERRNPYKVMVRDIIREEKIKYFVDIHGLKDGNMYDIAIYYPTKFSRSKNLALKLQEDLGRGRLSGVSIAIFRFLDNSQETLGEYVASKLRVPSVQIEIARYIREDDILREELVANLSRSLCELFV